MSREEDRWPPTCATGWATCASAHATGDAPADLWQRGVRRRRLRAGAAAMVVVPGAPARGRRLVVAARPHAGRASGPAGGAAPAGPVLRGESLAALLRRSAGSPRAVFPAPRKTLSSQTNGLVGVTASSGTYGFLDLPDAPSVDSGQPVCAPRTAGTSPSGCPGPTPRSSEHHVYDGTTITGVGIVRHDDRAVAGSAGSPPRTVCSPTCCSGATTRGCC